MVLFRSGGWCYGDLKLVVGVGVFFSLGLVFFVVVGN